MADAFSLSFDDDDLLGPAVAVLPTFYTSQLKASGSGAAVDMVSQPSPRQTLNQHPAVSNLTVQSNYADRVDPPATKRPRSSQSNISMHDFLGSQLSMTGPNFQYSLATSQEDSRASTAAARTSKGDGKPLNSAGQQRLVHGTLTQSPIRRHDPSSHSGSGDDEREGRLRPTTKSADASCESPTESAELVRRIPGPAGLIHLAQNETLQHDSTSTQTMLAQAASTAGTDGSHLDGPDDIVLQAWFTAGSWRQMCIDLDLPPAAAPHGVFEEQSANQSAPSSARHAASAVIPLKKFIGQASDNDRMCWKSVPGLALLVTAFRSTAAGGLAVVQDWTGSVRATIARDVLQDFGTAIAVGSCLALAGVSIVQPSPGRLYINIRSCCVARVYPPDCPQPKLRHTLQQHSQITDSS
jgi:hypothetical protein